MAEIQEAAASGRRAEMPNPTEAELHSRLFGAIWQATKRWDVNAPEFYDGYCGMNGSHVTVILRAVRAAEAEMRAESAALRPARPDFTAAQPFAGPDHPVTATCWSCGFTWERGQDGSHSCAQTLHAFLAGMAAELDERERLGSESISRTARLEAQVRELTEQRDRWYGKALDRADRDGIRAQRDLLAGEVYELKSQIIDSRKTEECWRRSYSTYVEMASAAHRALSWERDRLRTGQNAYQDDLAAILRALGLNHSARPASPREVVRGEVLPAIEALSSRVRDLSAGELCDGCLGKGSAISGPCGCGGSGRMSDMVASLRVAALVDLPRQIAELEAERDRLREENEEARGWARDTEAANNMHLEKVDRLRALAARMREWISDRMDEAEPLSGAPGAPCRFWVESGAALLSDQDGKAAYSWLGDMVTRNHNEGFERGQGERDRLRASTSRLRSWISRVLRDPKCLFSIEQVKESSALLADPDCQAAAEWLEAERAAARGQGRREALATRMPSDPVGEALADGEEAGYRRGYREGMAFAANVERHGGTMGEYMRIECAVVDAAVKGGAA